MRYMLVIAPGAAELIQNVNAAIAEGWIPRGGVSMSAVCVETEDHRHRTTESEIRYTFAQAMTRGKLCETCP